MSALNLEHRTPSDWASAGWVHITIGSGFTPSVWRLGETIAEVWTDGVYLWLRVRRAGGPDDWVDRGTLMRVAESFGMGDGARYGWNRICVLAEVAP